MKTRLNFHGAFVLVLGYIFLLVIAQTTTAQPQYKCLGKKLSLENILNVLQGRSFNLNMTERNDYATNCVKKDGVSFIVTSNDEIKLKEARAGNILIDAIRIECGLKPLQNQKLYPSEITWASSPRLPGKWQTLNLRDSQSMTNQLIKETPKKLVNTVRQIKKFRTLILPFYPGTELVEGLVPNAGILTFILHRSGTITLLNGTSQPIHELNAQIPLLLDNTEKVEDYLKFFCFQVFGEEGDFRLIESRDEVLWMKGATLAEKQRIGKNIKLLEIEKSGDQSWGAKATVQYSDALFHVKFSIKKSGMIEMLDDTPLEADLAVRGESFNGYLRVEFDGKNVSKSSIEADYANRGAGAFDKGDYKNAITLYSEAIKNNSRNAELYMKRGFSYHYYGEGNTAIEDYKQAVKSKPELGALPLHKCLPFQTGDKNADAVLESCNLAIQANPRFALLYYKRALIFFTKNDNNRGNADIAEAIKLNPNFVSAYYYRGITQSNNGNYDLAVKDFSKAIELNSGSIYSYIGRGEAYSKKSLKEDTFLRRTNYEQAVRDYSKAVEIKPLDGYIARGNFYYNEKNYTLAFEDFNQAVKLKTDNSDVYFRRGYIYTSRNEYDLAINDYTKAISLNQDDAAYVNRGFCYYKKGESEKAAADYRKALQINPNNETAKKNLNAISKENQ